MAAQVLEKRVQTLENRVTRLEELPRRTDNLGSQILRVRIDMAAEFSTVREEIRSGDDRIIATLGTEIQSVDAGLRQEMGALATGLRQEMGAVVAGLRQEIQTTNVGLGQAIHDARRENRILFEEYVSRLAVVDEGKDARRRPRKPKGTRGTP